MTSAIAVSGLSHRYGDRLALDDLSIEVPRGEVFGLLGPNGGGKTTLFRILCTLLPVRTGDVRVLGLDVTNDQDAVRRRIGITFQSPSLDAKLTVRENLLHQAHLYGLRGRDAADRIASLVERLGLGDRTRDRIDSLSGGLKRRVEIAKGLLHDPELLLLDEPSTGLDPGARHDLWVLLERLRSDRGVTVLVTTHLMEEAERCDRLGILDRGRLVAEGTPAELRRSVGGDCLVIECPDPNELASAINERFGIEPTAVDGMLRIERENGHDLLRDVAAAFPDRITSISLGKPTLEDVFIARTGHRFWAEAPSNGIG